MKKIIILTIVLLTSITLIFSMAFIPKNVIDVQSDNEIEIENHISDHPEAGRIEEIGH